MICWKYIYLKNKLNDVKIEQPKNIRVADYQLTDNVKEVIKIEKGYVTYAVVNSKTNKIYIAYPNFILAVDCNTMNVVARIDMGELARIDRLEQKELVVNEAINKIYAISGGKIHVINGDTNKLDTILEHGYRANYIAVNPISNSLYISNRDADSVVVYDCTTDSKIVEVRVKTPAGVAIDSIKNKIYVANSDPTKDLNTISIIDGTSNEINDNIVFPTEKSGLLSGVWQHLDKRALINESNRLLYIIGSLTRSGGGAGGTVNVLFVVDIEKRHLVNKHYLGSDICLAVNQYNNSIYLRDAGKNTILKLDECARKVIESVEVVKMGFWRRVFSARQEALVFNPITHKVYQTDGRYGLLYVLDS